jgi:uncharacterized membrane protein
LNASGFRTRAAHALDVLLALAAALLVTALVVWRSSLPVGRLSELRPDDVLSGTLVLLAARCTLLPPALALPRPGRIVAVGVVVYALVFSWIAVGRHLTFQTHALDLGQYAQNLWHIAHGMPPYDTATGWHVWGNHFSPIFYLLAPFSLVVPGPIWLLVFQSVALGLGGVPLYLLARRRLSPPLAAAVALLYLANPSLHGINIRDFHPAALAIPLLLTAMYAWDAGRLALFALATAMVLTTREDAAIPVVGLGLWLAVSRRTWPAGAAVALIGVAWLFATVQWLMPAFRDDAVYPYVGAHYRHLGASLGAVIASPIVRPRVVLQSLLQASRLQYLALLLAPLAFLPLLAPACAVGALPGLAQNMLSDYPVLLNYRSQYQAFALPFLLVATVAALARLEGGRVAPAARWLTPRRAVAVAAFVSLVLTARTVNELAVVGWWPGPRHRAAERLMRELPPGATVSATERLFPHLYERAIPFVFPDRAASSAYVLVDRATLTRSAIATDARLRVVGEAHGLVLLRRDY